MRNCKIWAGEIAAFLRLPLYGDDIRIERVSSLSKVAGNSLVFVKKADHPDIKNIAERRDVFALLPMECLAESFKCPRAFSERPRLSFAKAVQHFFVEKPAPVVSDLALVSSEALVGEGVSIGPHSIIEGDVVIGDNTEIRNNVLIKKGTRIGKNCIIRAFTVIGEEGFGFERDEAQRPVRIPHIGNVILGDDIEIGNLCTVCRGTIDDTVIRDGVKIDDHCHISHNVSIGSETIITGGSMISGSVTLGSCVWIGPNASILNGISIGSNSTVGTGAVVIRNVPDHAHVLGNPALNLK